MKKVYLKVFHVYEKKKNIRLHVLIINVKSKVGSGYGFFSYGSASMRKNISALLLLNMNNFDKGAGIEALLFTGKSALNY